MKPFDWQFPYPSQRMPILARNCVATSQPLAAQAGLRMLMKGGSAVDAVLATAISLTVLEPTSNGIGSDAFAILWDGKKLQGLNASGRSPAAWTPDRFKGLNAMPQRGWDSVTVPGAISAWVELSSKYGKLPFADLFEPAIDYASRGYMQVQQAVEAQRFSSASFPNSFAPHDYFPGRLCIEEDMPNGVIDEMKKRGHDVQVLPRLPAQSGAVCAVMRDPQTGLKHAGADPRREAYALGW